MRVSMMRLAPSARRACYLGADRRRNTPAASDPSKPSTSPQKAPNTPNSAKMPGQQGVRQAGVARVTELRASRKCLRTGQTTRSHCREFAVRLTVGRSYSGSQLLRPDDGYSARARPQELICRPLSARRLVRGDQHAPARAAAVNQPQGCLRAAREQPPTGAQHQGMNHQQVLVYQIGGHQRAD